MKLVRFDIAQVVDQVDRRAHRAEAQDGGDPVEQRVELEQAPVEDKRRPDDSVLGPLMRPHGPQQRWEPDTEGNPAPIDGVAGEFWR